ncbi:MAG: hypothetical protein II178_04185, partial [Selenomonadaceae bacterium]|nr:hypothetical protein [Selenomonadaceae bacterium]
MQRVLSILQNSVYLCRIMAQGFGSALFLRDGRNGKIGVEYIKGEQGNEDSSLGEISCNDGF